MFGSDLASEPGLECFSVTLDAVRQCNRSTNELGNLNFKNLRSLVFVLQNPKELNFCHNDRNASVSLGVGHVLELGN